MTFKRCSRVTIALLLVAAATGCGNFLTLGPLPANRARSTVSPAFQPEVYDRVAILVEDRTGRLRYGGSGEGALREVEDEFTSHLIGKGYAVAARGADVDRVLEELRFQRQGVTDRDVQQLGRMLNVPAVLLVSINENSSSSEYVRYTDGSAGTIYWGSGAIGARLISVERGEVLWISSYSTRIQIAQGSEQTRVLAPIAQGVASAFPDRYPPPSDPDV